MATSHCSANAKCRQAESRCGASRYMCIYTAVGGSRSRRERERRSRRRRRRSRAERERPEGQRDQTGRSRSMPHTHTEGVYHVCSLFWSALLYVFWAGLVYISTFTESALPYLALLS